MSRFRAWLGSLTCRWMGGHLPSPIAVPASGSSSIVSACLRCDRPLVLWSKYLSSDPSLFGVLSFAQPISPRSAEAWRLAWAQASDARTSPSLLDRDTESASVRHGAGR